MNKNECQQGSVTQQPVLCQERPYRFDNGKIYFYHSVVLVKTRVSLFGKEIEMKIDQDAGEEIAKALNHAYKMGYEKDRWEWK